MKITLNEKQEMLLLGGVSILVVIVLAAVGQSALRQYQAKQVQSDISATLQQLGSDSEIKSALQNESSKLYSLLEKAKDVNDHPPIINIPIIYGAEGQSKLESRICGLLLEIIADAGAEVETARLATDYFFEYCVRWPKGNPRQA